MTSFGRGDLEVPSGRYYSVRLACLDSVELAALAEVPVRYANGRENGWFAAPAVMLHL